MFLPASKEVVVIVTTAKLLSAHMLPPDAGRVDGHAKESWRWEPC